MPLAVGHMISNKHINRLSIPILYGQRWSSLHALMGTDSICNVSHVIIHVTMWTGFWVEDSMCIVLSVMLTYDRIVRLVWVVLQYKLVTHLTWVHNVRWCWVAVFALLSFLDVWVGFSGSPLYMNGIILSCVVCTDVTMFGSVQWPMMIWTNRIVASCLDEFQSCQSECWVELVSSYTLYNGY